MADGTPKPLEALRDSTRTRVLATQAVTPTLPIQFLGPEETGVYQKTKRALEFASKQFFYAKIGAFVVSALEQYGRSLGGPLPPHEDRQDTKALRLLVSIIDTVNQNIEERPAIRTAFCILTATTTTLVAIKLAAEGFKWFRTFLFFCAEQKKTIKIKKLAWFVLSVVAICCMAYAFVNYSRKTELVVYRKEFQDVARLLDPEFLPGFATVEEFKTELTAELYSSNILPVLSVMGANLAMRGLPAPRLPEYWISPRRQMQEQEKQTTDIIASLRDEVGDGQFGPRMFELARTAFEKNLLWTQRSTDDIISMLYDLSAFKGFAGDNDREPILFTKEVPGVKWAPRNVLEAATNSSWAKLPTTMGYQGAYVYPEELARLVDQESGNCLWHPDVMFTHDANTVSEAVESKLEEYRRRQAESCEANDFEPSQVTGRPPDPKRLTPTNVPQMRLRELKELFQNIPFAAGEKPGTNVLEKIGTFWASDRSYFESWAVKLKNRLSGLYDEIAERERESMMCFVDSQNRQLDQLNAARARVLKAGLDRVTCDAERAAILKVFDDEGADRDEEWWEAPEFRILGFGSVLGLFALLVRALIGAAKEKTNSSALDDKKRQVSDQNKREFELPAVADILVYAWDKLVRLPKEERFPMTMETASAPFQGAGEDPAEGVSGALAARHFSRMADIKTAYAVANGESDEAERTLGLVLSTGSDLGIDDARFWLRLYLWEIVCNDSEAPYTPKVKRDLFNKIRHGHCPTDAKLCQRVNETGEFACEGLKQGARNESQIWFMRSNRVWGLIDLKENVMDTRIKPETRKILDSLHAEKRTTGYCLECAAKLNFFVGDDRVYRKEDFGRRLEDIIAHQRLMEDAKGQRDMKAVTQRQVQNALTKRAVENAAGSESAGGGTKPRRALQLL